MEGWSCAACAGDNPFGMGFCGYCGERDGTDWTVRDDVWACRGCATTNAVVMGFCGRCGQQRGEQRQDDLRLVTALFADISGFTTLADQLDPEALHEIINPLIGGLARIAERYDGFITKYAGDALLCLFGAPVAHEDDAQRALLAALEMHATLPTLLAELGPHAAGLTIHIGVNTGKVVAGSVGSAMQADYSVLGDSVILAQRLESVCPSGQTYVGESTHDLCQGEFDFEDVGELQLKGKLHAVRGFRLVGRRRAGTDISRPLVGRDAELGTVLDAVLRCRVAAVVGEPGIGKSRLLAEARVRATGAGVLWLPARCLSYGAALPYWPFVDLLRQALGLRVEDPVEDVLDRLRQRLPAELIDGAARLLGLSAAELEPQAARKQVHDALSGMLSVLSGGRAVVLAVEDVHWIDAASHDALAELIRVPGGVPLSVVLTSRVEGREVAAGLAGDALVDLEPLGPEAVPLIAEAVLDRPVAPGLVEVLLHRSGGNPLFVEELSRSLKDETRLVDTTAGLDLPPGFDVTSLPDTVERVFAARVDLLQPDDQHVLATCAAIGRVARHSLLAAVLGDDPHDALTRLTAAELLEHVIDSDDPAVTFHHALLQDVVYGRLLRKHKQQLHRRIADVGRQLYGDTDNTIELLARHLYLAGAGEEAVDPLLRAGRRAQRLYANDAAAEHLARAVEVLSELRPGSAELSEARLLLAGVEEVRGRYDEALALYDGERVRTNEPRAWRGSLAVQRMQGSYAEVVAGFQAAGSSLELTSTQALPLWLETANSLALMGRFSDAVTMLRTLMRLPALTDDALRGEALTRLAWAESQLKIPRAMDDALKAVALLEQIGDLYRLVAALRVAGPILDELGDRRGATAVLERGFAVAEKIGLQVEAAGCLLNVGLLDLDVDPPAAVPRFRAALDLFRRIGHLGGQCAAMANLADALARAREYSEADLVAVDALKLSRRIGHQLGEADVLHTMAKIALGQADPQRAVHLAERAAELFAAVDLDQQRAEARATAARAHVLLSASATEGEVLTHAGTDGGRSV